MLERILKSKSSNNEAVLAIVGGGIAGCVQAIYLAEEFPWLKIRILEKRTDILTGTSSMNPGRPTFGFHYRHLDTATFCQDNTVKFTEFLQRIGCPHIFAKAPQRGIYVLMKEAIQILGNNIEPVFSSEEIQQVFEQIRLHAIKTYTNDTLFTKFFGPPDQLCRELNPCEYESFLAPEVLEQVGACYETAERTFDTLGICAFLRNYIKRFDNITVSTEANVTSLQKSQRSKGRGYRIDWYDEREAKHKTEFAKFLTLACWENIGLFRNQLGKPEREPTYNRLKMLAIVDIELKGKLLETIRPIFAASGPFCMISPQKFIQGFKGQIYCRCACTLAIKTNVATILDTQVMPADYDAILSGNISHEEKMEMAAPILEGARQVINCLKHAKLVDVRFGTVRVPYGGGNSVDLHDPASEHHSRNYPGCYQLDDGLFVNESMKLIYSVHNAEKIVDWVRDNVIN